ncbi:MAG TPA: helix-turn-helix transcriptional regulator [Clostridia bacterium]|nr:helix-turn-helix transcriptional regulator [Clostridia bacterium]
MTETGKEDTLLVDNVVNISGLRKQNYPYVFIWIFYYAWVVAFASWWTASPLADNVFSTQLRGLMHSVNLLSSTAFVFIIRKEWFIKASRIGAVVIAAGMIVFFTVPDERIRILSAVVSSIAIGCVNISFLIPFVFILNNTEKLYAVVGSNILIQLILIIQEMSTGARLYKNIVFILSFVILTISLAAIIFFRKTDIVDTDDEREQSKPEFHRRIYLTIFLNCAIVVLCKGAGKGVLNVAAVGSHLPVLVWHYIGGLIGCLIFVLIYAFTEKAFVWLGNITFSTVAIGLLCNAFGAQFPGLTVVFSILLGIGNTVGMINLYYIVGVVGRKYNSMRYVRLSILFIGACGGLSGIVLGYVISIIGTFEISIAASMVSAVVTTLFLFASPIFAQTHFENDWAKDSQHIDIDNEQFYVFKKYNLSKREAEVCNLLLQGYTMRQISGILAIAYPTVNTYCTSVYRKLNINSRTELLILFKEYTIK